MHKWIDGDGENLTNEEYEAGIFIPGGGCCDGYKFYKDFTNWIKVSILLTTYRLVWSGSTEVGRI